VQSGASGQSQQMQARINAACVKVYKEKIVMLFSSEI
jgi:hypothetical protein